MKINSKKDLEQLLQIFPTTQKYLFHINYYKYINQIKNEREK